MCIRDRKKESLLRENEKLRNDAKSTRRGGALGLVSNAVLSLTRNNLAKRPQSPMSTTSNSSKGEKKYILNNQNLLDITNFGGIKTYDSSKQINKSITLDEEVLEKMN
eukprot:TRINITY_DN11143_c0_g1_i1.p1 TRINITY_DN11143_c0_g1~~TRINITY_DN11143_c0_g1_i1.p1  ORF type:complete len:108 (-),score=32.84 TRINITY_DN11143_c0_g1_i1:17-340(-)